MAQRQGSPAFGGGRGRRPGTGGIPGRTRSARRQVPWRGRRRASATAMVMALAVLVGVGASAAGAAAAPASTSSGGPGAALDGTTSSTVGVTSSTVTVGQVDTLSGPVPGLFEGAEKGTQAYFAYLNSQGGVDGRKIELKTDDDQFSASNYATDTEQLVDSTFALVGGFSLFDDAAGALSAINTAKIPDVTFSLSQGRALDPYNYSPDPLVVGGSRLGPFKYYKKKYPKAIKHVATLYTNAAASAVAQTESDLHAMGSLGYKLSFIEQVGALQADFTAEVLRMKSDGTQMVYIVGMSVGQVADLAKAMAQQDFKPAVFSTNGVAYDQQYIPLAGSAANGTETDMTSAMFIGQDAKRVPAVKLFDKWMDKVGGAKFLDTYALEGWASAQLFAQALKAAGPDPTRTSVMAQLNKITTFTAGGLLSPGNPVLKKPETCWILVKVVNGKWVRTGPDPKKGFVCSPGGYYYPPGYTPFVRAPGT